jgi:protein-tyrosine-phosphatase
MGCGDECPHVQAKKREDWEIPDPKYMEMDRFNQIRDLIEKKVIDLIEILRPSEKPIEERR